MCKALKEKESGKYIKLSLTVCAPAASTALPRVTAERKEIPVGYRLYSKTLRVQVQELFALRG
jgi:hypothetical protein